MSSHNNKQHFCHFKNTFKKHFFLCYKVTISDTVTIGRSLKTISWFHLTLTINSEINKTRIKLMLHFSLLFLQHFFSQCSSFFEVGVLRQSQSGWGQEGFFFSTHTLQRWVFGFVSIREDELHHFIRAFILLSEIMSMYECLQNCYFLKIF